MKNTLLNVVIHFGDKLRLWVINKEYTLAPPPRKIIIKNLSGVNDDIIINCNNYYSKYGSIYHKRISEWLHDSGFGRTRKDNIWLLKFKFSTDGENHVFTYIGVSKYKKIPSRPILLLGKEEYPCPDNDQLAEFIWKNDRL